MAKKPMPFEKGPKDKESPKAKEGGARDKAMDRKQGGKC